MANLSAAAQFVSSVEKAHRLGLPLNVYRSVAGKVLTCPVKYVGLLPAGGPDDAVSLEYQVPGEVESRVIVATMLDLQVIGQQVVQFLSDYNRVLVKNMTDRRASMSFQSSSFPGSTGL